MIYTCSSQTVTCQNVFCEKGSTKSLDDSFAGSSGRRDPRSPFGQQNGHGRREGGVIQRSWATGSREFNSKQVDHFIWCAQVQWGSSVSSPKPIMPLISCQILFWSQHKGAITDNQFLNSWYILYPVQENKVMFSEVSAYTAKNVTESLTQLAR